MIPAPRAGRFTTAARAARITAVTAGHVVRSAPALGVAAVRGPAAVRAAAVAGLQDLTIALGPSFIKAAQLLSTRRDVLPGPVCEALGELTDRVPPMPAAAARAAVDSAYRGRPWPFAAIDETAVASGSIACVYRATLLDGREVAVKVRRPGIGGLMATDFRLLRMGAALMQRLPGFRRLPATRIVDQLADAVLGQLDFVAEAGALALMRRNFAGQGHLRLPEPLEDASADGVLVMEFLPGLRRMRREDLPPETAVLAVRRILRCAYQMLFLDGLVHCDMHPGNLYLSADGGIVLLDMGFVVVLSPKVRRLFAEFFLNMARGNGEYCADIIVRSAEDTAGADLDAFRADIVELIAGSTERTAGEFELGPFAASLFDLQRRHGVSAAPEFVFPLLSLLVLEGMINEYDADVDFQAEAKPMLIKALLTGVPREAAKPREARAG
ncbi:AarF/UbiB family protein [Actinoplanes sp. NPDC023801]|uniref:ABC1 kinase family protein n=1 Tax=Actinoplanes sp. NPDC023801 TaxID=3154595 RepID=UPI0033E95FC8